MSPKGHDTVDTNSFNADHEERTLDLSSIEKSYAQVLLLLKFNIQELPLVHPRRERHGMDSQPTQSAIRMTREQTRLSGRRMPSKCSHTLPSEPRKPKKPPMCSKSF